MSSLQKHSRRAFLVVLTAVACLLSPVPRPAAQSPGIAIGPSQSGVSSQAVRCPAGPVSREQSDAQVSNFAQLKDAIASGHRIIWIENGATIDVTVVDHRDHYQDYALYIPSNVTLASGRSPTQPGGLLSFSPEREHPRFMLRLDACSRVTGLRMRGPSRSTEPDHPANVAILIRSVEHVLVDNNEFSDWPGAGVKVSNAPNAYQTASTIRITQNFFHHNLMCGFGYGVEVDADRTTLDVGGYAYIDRNVFDYNRHAIAGDGHPATGYLAERNLVLSGGKTCDSWLPGATYYNQHFDMHGFPDGDGGPAGETITIRYNSVRGEQDYYLVKTRPAFWLRGQPEAGAYFYGNVLAHDDRDEAVRTNGNTTRIYVGDNDYNVDTSNELAVGDFDGDGVDDVFQATGTAWMFSARGQSDWRYLSSRGERLARLLFGDFDGNGKTDVFTQDGDKWLVSYDAVSAWTPLPFGSAVPMSTYRIGDFDGDGKADVFRTTGSQWLYSKGGAAAWERLARSGHTADTVRFGDFDGDGTTDVFGLVNGEWSVASTRQSGWRRLNDLISSNLEELVFADFNGDRVTDIARQHGLDYQVSWGGSSDWETLHADALKELFWPLTSVLLGDFTGDRRADALHYERSFFGVGERFLLSSRATRPYVVRSLHEMR